MSRSYRFARGGSGRLLAAVALAAALAGCGASTSGAGSATTGAGGAPATGAGSQTSGSQSPGGTGSGAGAGALGANGPRPGDVSTSLIQQAGAPKVGQGGSSLGRASAPSVRGGSAAGLGTSTGAAPTPASTGQSSTQATDTTATPAVLVVVKLKTVVRHVIVHVPTRPSGPLTAFLPSRHPALDQTRFVVTGGNIGCSLEAGRLRCTVKRRVWAGPVQPQTCRAGWGNTIALSDKGAAQFQCASASAIATGAKVIPNGWDDRLGSFTCQVRSIGVDCFSSSDHGLMISRTGYATY